MQGHIRLGGRDVASNSQLVDVYRERVEKMGLCGRMMFYASEDQYQAKVSQFGILLHRLVKPSETVLDVGCGYGSLAAVMPVCRYSGIDLVPEFIAFARSRYPNLEFCVGEIEQWPGTADWCVLLGVVNGIPNPPKTLDAAWGACRKGLVVDFIDKRKLKVDDASPNTLNAFDVGQCLGDLLAKGAKKVEVLSTPFAWTIFVAYKSGEWIEWR